MGLLDQLKGIFGKKPSKEQVSQQAESEALGAKLMEAHRNRKIYKRLTTGDIDATDDEMLGEVIWDNLALKNNADYSDELKIVGTFSLAQQAIYHIWLMEAEVNNGGLIQFYDNSSGEFAHLLPDSLHLIGATQFKDLMIRANERVAAYQQRLQSGQATEDEWYEFMNDLDSEFFALYPQEPLGQLLVEFIRRNKEAFVDV